MAWGPDFAAGGDVRAVAGRPPVQFAERIGSFRSSCCRILPRLRRWMATGSTSSFGKIEEPRASRAQLTGLEANSSYANVLHFLSNHRAAWAGPGRELSTC